MAAFRQPLAGDVAASSASILCNLLPELMKLEPRAFYDRVVAHLEAMIRAYCDGLCAWGLESADSDPMLTLSARIAEFRGKLNAVHQLAGPELRILMDTYDFPFSTTNAVLTFGRRLVKSVLEAKEALARFDECLGESGMGPTRSSETAAAP